MTKPAVFIGSSTEALDVARHFQIALEGVFECEATVWDQDVFTPGLYAMEALVEQAESSDFAVLLVTPDDLVEARGQITPPLRATTCCSRLACSWERSECVASSCSARMGG